MVTEDPGAEGIQILDVHVLHPLLPGEVKLDPPFKGAAHQILFEGHVGVVALSFDKHLKLSEVPDAGVACTDCR